MKDDDRILWKEGDVVRPSMGFQSIRIWDGEMKESVGWFCDDELGWVVDYHGCYIRILTNTGKFGYVLDNMVVGVRCNS